VVPFRDSEDDAARFTNFGIDQTAANLNLEQLWFKSPHENSRHQRHGLWTATL